MAAQEEKLRELAEKEQLLAASIAQVVGAAEPAVSEAQLGLQRVSPASFSQLVCRPCTWWQLWALPRAAGSSLAHVVCPGSSILCRSPC